MKRFFQRRRAKFAFEGATKNAIRAEARSDKPDWERTLTASLEQNCVAPSDDAIIHAYDLYCEELYAPFLARRHEMADLYADIASDIAALHALAPGLIDQAMARHPYEFSHILVEKE